MNQQNEIIIDASKRPKIRNWIIKISDIRRILIHKKTSNEKETDSLSDNSKYYIEIRYNSPDNLDKDIDVLSYKSNDIVIMFYKIINTIKKAKEKKYNDDYIIIQEKEVYLLSEVTITGI